MSSQIALGVEKGACSMELVVVSQVFLKNYSHPSSPQRLPFVFSGCGILG